jgi:hypothetical protein
MTQRQLDPASPHLTTKDLSSYADSSLGESAFELTPAMTQWEYTFIALAAPAVNPYLARDAPVQQQERLAEQLAYLGAQGWEAVGQITLEVRGGKNNYPQLLMKRPVARS